MRSKYDRTISKPGDPLISLLNMKNVAKIHIQDFHILFSKGLNYKNVITRT